MIATFSLINRLPRAAADHRQRTLLRRCGAQDSHGKTFNDGSVVVMAVEFIIVLKRKKPSTVIEYEQEDDHDYPTT